MTLREVEKEIGAKGQSVAGKEYPECKLGVGLTCVTQRLQKIIAINHLGVGLLTGVSPI